jgi:hypothetical protein
MPRIPDATSLGYSVPQARTPRFQDRSGQIVGDATQRLAGTIGQAADVLQEREDKFAYAQAKSALLQADIEARRELENDGDWATYETRYSEKMAKAREKATGLIRSNRDRALFDMDAKLDVERGVGEIRGVSKRKEIDWGRGALDATLEANRTAALNAKDEQTRAALIAATQEMIGGAKAKGYVSEQEAVNHQQVWTANYAEAYVGMQPATDRIALLSKPKGTVADYIAPDKRVALLEAAKNENRDLTVRRESQAQEDAIVAKYGTSTAALKAARDIENPEVRDSTVNRIKVRQAEAKQAELEHAEALSEEALAFINEGGKFADLPLKIKNGLKPSTLNSLRSYAEQMAGGGVRRTDPEALIELSELSADDPQKFGEMNLLEYRPKLSDGDFEEFVDLQRKIRTGSLDGKATGFMTINQVRDERLRDIFGSAQPASKEGPKVSASRRKFVSMYENRLRAFREETGKRPGTDDARKILDEMTAEVAIDWGRDKPVYELDEGDIPDVPDADRNEIIRELQKRGKPVTEEAIVNLYRSVNAPRASTEQPAQ